jgi:hypothetical protein
VKYAEEPDGPGPVMSRYTAAARIPAPPRTTPTMYRPLQPVILPLVLLLGVQLAALPADDEAALAVSPGGHHDVELTRPDGDTWQLRTTATDPWVVSVPRAESLDLKRLPVLSFEYLCVSGIDDLQVFMEQPWSEQRSIHLGPLPPRQGWTEYSADLQSAAAIHQLRLDFGDKPGAVVQLRHLRLRARNQEERDAAARAAGKREEDRQLELALHEYLGHPFASHIDGVVALAETIEVRATVPEAGAAGMELAEWPAWVPLTSPLHLSHFQPLTPAAGGMVRISVPRFIDGYDRVLSRWVLVRREGAGAVPVSHARWADDLPAANPLPELRSRTRKGLGGFHAGLRDSDLDELGISAVTVNISLAQLLKAEAGSGTSEITAAGRTWHVDRAALERLDATMLAAAQRGIVVLGIILIENAKHWASPELGRIFQHPDYQADGIFSMANVTSPEGVGGYATMMELLAERYGRPDGRYGRVHHWIIHNEVDMGWVWTNCGARPELVFLDQYHKALRIAYYMARRHDPNARVYISLTQWWNRSEDPAHCHPSHALLDDLSAFSAAEGDFAWGIAYHPYPDSLFEPKSWLDRNVDFTLATPKITFRNIEVLDAWAQLPANRYHGTTVRSIHLSEQGPNSRDYSAQALAEQAAAMAYVWKKIGVLSSIEAFEYHNWIDNRGEGGLRIGLRRFPDDPESPLGAKPVWQLYRALATPGEDAACEFAKAIIGISSWDEVRQARLVTVPR